MASDIVDIDGWRAKKAYKNVINIVNDQVVVFEEVIVENRLWAGTTKDCK